MTNQLASQLQELHFSAVVLPDMAWRPPVNVYCYSDRIEVCVDLAGVPREDIDVRVEPRRLAVCGHRPSPDPDCPRLPCGRILAMEIAEGQFERILDLPAEVAPDRAEARQENGFLWISLPRA